LLSENSLAQNSWKKYSVDDGLSSNIVYEVYQGSDKYLWFSTELGVSRFDGKNFANYSFKNNLPDNVVYETKELDSKDKWFLSGNGKLSFLSYSTKKIESVPGFGFKSFASELIELPNGDVVASSFGDGIKRNRKGKVFIIDKSEGLGDNYISFIWNIENIVYAISLTGIYEISSSNKVKKVVAFNESIHFSRACRISEGQVILSAKDKIFLFENNSLKLLRNSSSLVGNTINQLTITKDGELAACTKRGVQFFKIISDSIVLGRAIFEKEEATNIILDHENNYWISTLGGGVIMYPKESFKRIAGSKKAYSFFNTNNKLLIGYENYTFAELEKNEFTFYELIHKNNYGEQKIRSLQKVNDEFWFVLDGGAALLKNGQTSFYRTGSGELLFMEDSVYLVNKQGFWKMSKSYLLDSLLITSSSKKIVLRNDNRLLDVHSTALHRFKSRTIIGTKEGLFIEKNGVVSKSTHSILSKAKISGITSLDNALIVSTFGYGVFILREKDTLHLSVNEGLSSNFCQAVSAERNNLVIGTKRGVNIVSSFLDKDFTLTSFTKQNGLSDEDINDVTIFKNRVYVATLSGVFSLSLAQISTRKTEIPLFLELRKVNGELIEESTSSFSYDQNRLSFFITPISFKYSDRVKLYYRLVNKKNDWVEINGNHLEFNSLNHGKYNLEVKAVIDNKESKVVSYTFQITPPFWKTWWFLVSVILSVILLVYWFFKIRVLTYNRDVVRELIILFINKLKKEEFIIVKDVKDGAQTKIILNQVQFAKGASNYVELHLNNSRKVFVRTTMKSILEQLNNTKKKEFIRCHKSFIVNVRNLTAVHGDFIKIEDSVIPIGKQYIKSISEKLELL